MYRVRTPQLEAGLVLAGHLHTRVKDGHVLESACKKEILVKTTTLSETPPHPLFEALLSCVRSMVEARTAGLVQVAGQRRQEEHYQVLKELEDSRTGGENGDAVGGEGGEGGMGWGREGERGEEGGGGGERMGEGKEEGDNGVRSDGEW
jgi:hypothetical protein